MISTIIEGLDLAAAQQLPTGARSGLAELRPVEGGTAPYVYSGSGSWTQIANDNAGTFSYWRLTSPVVEVDTDGPSCNDYFQATYQLRLVSMVDRALCGNVIDAARSASSAIRGADQGVAQALGLSIPRTSVTKVSVETDSRRVYQNEFGTAGDVPPSLTLIAIDVTFVAVGSAACFAPCEVPGGLLCLSIAQATWAKIKACMSEAQLAAAEADLCTNTPCEPATVTFDGLEVGTVASGDTINLDCGTLLDAAYVVDGGSVTGIYTIDGTLNGRSVYRLDASHNLEYTGTRWRLVKPGSDVDATVGTEDFPWLATWTGVTVSQGTIAEFCGGPETVCDPLTLTVNDTAFDTEANPCGATVDVPVVDGTGTAVGLKVGTDWVVPTAKSLCELVTEGTSEEVATCVTASGKRPGVLAELIPTVDLADTVAQVFDVMTPAQQDLFDVTVQLEDSAGDPIGVPDVYSAGTTTTKTAPDGTVNVVDHLSQPLGSTTVKSNGTATVVVSDWEGEYPVLNENTPTYNDEGDSIAGWTVTGGSMASSASVNRLTQASTAAAASASRAVTMPTANGDWALYARIRARRTTGDAQLLAIDGTGSERAFIYFNFNTTTSASQLGTISIRGTNAAGTNSNAVYATGVFMDTNWQDVLLLYNHARLSFSIYIRQTDGSWLFGAQVNGTFFGSQVRFLANNTTTVGSWIEYDFLTLVAPNIQSIGNSLEQGATLFSPVVASGLTNGASTWQRWAPLYPAIRNNIIVNKGVGSNTTAMVAARIAADCIDMGAKLVILSACNNDLGASISQAQRTTNTQTSISLCTAAGIPVVLHNATYSTSAFAGQPASLNYYRTWWKDYRPTLTGLSGSIDTMGALKDPNGYADTLFTQSDNIHPNVTGYTRMGEWIAALPYA